MLAGGHAAELLPRSPDVLSAQVCRSCCGRCLLSGHPCCCSVHAALPTADALRHAMRDVRIVSGTDQAGVVNLCMQEDLVRSYDLPFEVVGHDSELRLRIHPRGYSSAEVEQRMGEEWVRSSNWHTA